MRRFPPQTRRDRRTTFKALPLGELPRERVRGLVKSALSEKPSPSAPLPPPPKGGHFVRCNRREKVTFPPTDP
jgi:hypothetical protein